MSLVGAPHTFVYDWQLLMLPLALLLNRRWGIVLAFGLYLYAIFWAVIGLGLELAVPSPAIIPAVVLIVMLSWRIQIEYQQAVALRHVQG